MKTKDLRYCEVKDLLLQGYAVKLPGWLGYWAMNKDKSAIEVHTKDLEITNTPDIMNTFYNNWEIATIENCPVMKTEIERNNRKIEVIDLDVIVTPFKEHIPVILVRENNNKVMTMSATSFIKFVGNGDAAHELVTNFIRKNIPEEHILEMEDFFEAVVENANKKKDIKERLMKTKSEDIFEFVDGESFIDILDKIFS
ncbi:MAG: hypothetical protein ACRDDY_06215 [Clostridium sp.]|uniref:hypothetical protein n=1 Tax=Clostridium sp. TaxID=1506 RepID=UPI003EE815BA